MHKFLTTLHRWLGFPLGIFFVVTFGTGAITAVDELLKHIQLSPVVDDIAYESMPVTNQAEALQVITAGKDFIRAVSLPSAEFPYFELQQRIPKTDNNPPQNLTHRYRFDTYTEIQVIEEEKSPFFDTVLQLHRNFLLGKEGLWGIHGKYFVAWLGLIALLISLIGLWLWWPLRKSFKARHLVPGNTARKTLYFNHLSAGVVCLALIVMLAITGASISYRDVTQSILGVSKPSAPSPAIQVGEGWHNWLAKAYQLMPADAKLVQVRYPRPPRKGSKAVGEIYEFRFSSADNWFGLATSHVKINAIGGTITEVSRFETRSWSEKLYTVLVPLHTGRQLHWSYVLVLLLFSLLGTVMVVSGVVSFLQKNRKRKAKIKRQPKAVESDTSPSTPVQACIESK